MKKLYTNTEYSLSKSRDYLPLRCIHCHSKFYKEKHEIQKVYAGKTKSTLNFCSRKCAGSHKRVLQQVICKQCGTIFTKKNTEIKRYPIHFCSKSCVTTYFNIHKTYGSNVSKLEKYLQKELIDTYSTIHFHFNRKNTIGSELDIFIPELSIGFEINGIFHYRPIFGKKQLSFVQSNDAKKVKKCDELGIVLYIINTTTQNTFSVKSSYEFLKKITDIIDDRL